MNRAKIRSPPVRALIRDSAHAWPCSVSEAVTILAPRSLARSVGCLSPLLAVKVSIAAVVAVAAQDLACDVKEHALAVAARSVDENECVLANVAALGGSSCVSWLVVCFRLFLWLGLDGPGAALGDKR
jgi:hypothetical protein